MCFPPHSGSNTKSKSINDESKVDTQGQPPAQEGSGSEDQVPKDESRNSDTDIPEELEEEKKAATG